MREVEERITKDMNPVLAASRRDIDEIIRPGEIRTYLEAVVTMAYQAIGYRRVKNPRIWSLHDLKVLSG
jgi:acetyl-CoA carboxylase carboxyltransferase component